jgi:hypothetical protein
MGLAFCAAAAEPDKLANPAIDPAAFLRVVKQAADYRESHRLSEDEFIAMARLRGTVILDARSRDRYDELHVKGAINLPFPDITLDSLARLLPDKNGRVLIYCNNNFTNAPNPFPSKLASAALNLSTYTALYDYGYRNVYELGPLLDLRTTHIAFDMHPR